MNCQHIKGVRAVTPSAESAIDLGFPHDFMASEMVKHVLWGGARVGA
jgi:hypothetical protein